MPTARAITVRPSHRALLVRSVGLVALAGSLGCSGGSSLPSLVQDLAVTPPDLAVPLDLTVVPPDLTAGKPDAGVQCGQATCAPGQLCCVKIVGMMGAPMCADTCDTDAGGIPLECTGPENCPGGNPCCVSIALGGGGGPMTGGTMCGQSLDACKTSIDLQSLSITTRLCHQDADCAGNFLGQKARCCSIQNAAIHFCAAPVNMMGFMVTCP